MNIKRLTILRDHLRKLSRTPTIKRKRLFSLVSWVCYGYSCRTIVCAVGEACFLPELSGLNLSDGLPKFGAYLGWPAVEKYFGLSKRVAEWLFMEDHYRARQRNSPGAVANRITAYLGGARP